MSIDDIIATLATDFGKPGLSTKRAIGADEVREAYFDLRRVLDESPREGAEYAVKILEARVAEMDELLIRIGDVNRAYSALRAAELHELQDAGAVVNLGGGVA